MSATPAVSIRDPIHGFIRADGLEKSLIDSRPLQRLRSIRQLGFANLVFPGAEHSRFSHVLGAMHLAGRVYDALAMRSDGLLDPDRRSRERRLARVAALVHDLGHAPFSHSQRGCCVWNLRVFHRYAWIHCFVSGGHCETPPIAFFLSH